MTFGHFFLSAQMIATYFTKFLLEMFYLNSTLNFGIPTVLVFQLEVYYKVDRLQTGLTAQQGTTARWYSNKTSLSVSRTAHPPLKNSDQQVS